MRLTPKEWRPTIIAGFIFAAAVACYFIFVSVPLTAATAQGIDNKSAIDAQRQSSEQILKRLGAIEGRQGATQQQLQDLQQTEERNAKNQDIIMQFLLTGRRPNR